MALGGFGHLRMGSVLALRVVLPICTMLARSALSGNRFGEPLGTVAGGQGSVGFVSQCVAAG